MTIAHDPGGMQIGRPGAADCMNDVAWRSHVEPEALFDLWGPAPASPWSAYHRPTLFAALQARGKSLEPWPEEVPGLAPEAAPRVLPDWADERTAVILDVPGEYAVGLAAWIALRGGHEPVSTFNNWPHAMGLVPIHKALAALLYFAPWAREARERRPRGPHERGMPPVLMLDSRRMGERKPKVKEFDNRYFLLDSDLPSGPTLRRHGVERVVYVHRGDHEADDLNRYLHDLTRHVRLERAGALLDGWGITAPEPFAPPIRKTPYSTSTDPAFRGFRRSALGGFGVFLPESSSGGG